MSFEFSSCLAGFNLAIVKVPSSWRSVAGTLTEVSSKPSLLYLCVLLRVSNFQFQHQDDVDLRILKFNGRFIYQKDCSVFQSSSYILVKIFLLLVARIKNSDDEIHRCVLHILLSKLDCGIQGLELNSRTQLCEGLYSIFGLNKIFAACDIT